jgi:phosphogluconate dehydratase
MPLDSTIAHVTDRIRDRSADCRRIYLDRMGRAAEAGPVRAHLSCGNQAHAYAAMGPDKDALAGWARPESGHRDRLQRHAVGPSAVRGPIPH